jgi:cytidylate kinase
MEDLWASFVGLRYPNMKEPCIRAWVGISCVIVTIDGPAGAGKSTAARQLAQRLGFDFLDTGSLYRAVTWCAVQAGIEPDQTEELERMLHAVSIELPLGGTIVNGIDVTQAIRDPNVTRRVRDFAERALVRGFLTKISRELTLGRHVVTEGRDQGTVVFPDAECKFFMTATAEERASRRYQELQAKSLAGSFDEILADQRERDRRDSERELAPLRQAEDAILIDTTGLSLNQVVDLLESHVRKRLSHQNQTD